MLTKLWALGLVVLTYGMLSHHAAASLTPQLVWEGLEIKADNEAPNHLAVVLWDKAVPVEDIPRLVSELMNDKLDPIATADFLRQIEFYRQQRTLTP